MLKILLVPSVFLISILLTILLTSDNQKTPSDFSNTKQNKSLETKTESIQKPLDSELNPKTDNVFLKEESPKLELSEYRINQGETLLIELPPEIKNVFLNNDSIPYNKINQKNVAFVGFDTREPIGQNTLGYQILNENQIHKINFEIVEKNYPITKIIIPPKLAVQGITSDKLIQSISGSDTISLDKILSQKTDFYYFSKPFIYPLQHWSEVGGFGNVREDQNGSIRHLGVDLAGSIGDPIFATNTGRIAFAGELQNYGKSIVIDHGLQIFSIYLHLSKIDVKTDQIVNPGEIIGEVGNTGDYTLEPHLHFSIKIRGTSVNPKNFIQVSQNLNL